MPACLHQAPVCQLRQGRVRATRAAVACSHGAVAIQRVLYITHGSPCQSAHCLAGGLECNKIAEQPCMLLWDLAGAGQNSKQAWQKKALRDGKHLCACSSDDRLRVLAHVMAGRSHRNAACCMKHEADDKTLHRSARSSLRLIDPLEHLRQVPKGRS